MPKSIRIAVDIRIAGIITILVIIRGRVLLVKIQ